MQTALTAPGSKPGLKQFTIHIKGQQGAALQTCIARSSGQAWNIAFDLCERLLGGELPSSISVKPTQPVWGLQSGLLVQA